MGFNIKLAEKPFYGFQGEGSTQGKHSLFIRFLGCNLNCSFCDSKYANDGSSTYEIAENDLMDMILCSSNVVFTGGEPLLRKDKILELIRNISTHITTVEIETNGTVDTDLYELYRKGIQFNISPKENISQSKPNVNTSPIILNDIVDYDYYCVKFLLEKEGDIHYIKKTQERYGIPENRIYVQPVGTNKEAIYKIVKKYYNTIIENKWNLSARLHVLFFNDKRGV